MQSIIRNLVLVLLLSTVTSIAYGQYRPASGKKELGKETTGDGLIFRGMGSPWYIPQTNQDAYFYQNILDNEFWMFNRGWYKVYPLPDSVVYESALYDTLSYYFLGSGTSGKIPKFTGSRTLGNGLLSDNGNQVSIDDGNTSTAKSFRLDSWLTSNRPSVPNTGDVGYNISNNVYEGYLSSNWSSFVTTSLAAGKFTSQYVPYAAANGELTQTSEMKYVAAAFYLDVGIAGNSATIGRGGVSIDRQALSIRADGVNSTVVIDRNASTMSLFSNTAATSYLHTFRRGRGIASARLDIQQGDVEGALYFTGREGGDNYRTSSLITGIVDSTVSAGNVPGALLFYTTPVGGGVTPIERLRITNQGRVGIGPTNPARRLHVSGVVRIDSLVSFTPARILGANTDGDLGVWSMSILADSIDANTIKYGVETSAGTSNAAKGTYHLVDCTSGAKTVNPPSSPTQGDWFAVSDTRGESFTNNITISFTSTSDKLHSKTEDYILNYNYGFIKFTYINSTIGWIITN